MSVSLGTPAGESVQIGLHTIEIQGDCIVTRLNGPFTIDHIKQWCVLADRVIAAHGQLFTISDFALGGSFPSETRQYISYWPNVVHIRGSVLVGPSLIVNVVFAMIARATALVRKHTPPTATLKTESEAHAWIAALRPKQSAASH